MIGPNLCEDFKCVWFHVGVTKCMDGEYHVFLRGERISGKEDTVGGCSSDTIEGALSKCKDLAIKEGFIKL